MSLCFPFIKIIDARQLTVLADPSSRSFAGILTSNPAEAWMSVSCDYCMPSGRGLCVWLITRTEKSYRLCCVIVCDLETSRRRRPWPALGRSGTGKTTKYTNQAGNVGLILFVNTGNIMLYLFLQIFYPQINT